MFGKKVIYISLFALLPAPLWCGGWFNNWWRNSEKKQQNELQKIRRGYQNIYSDTVANLEGGGNPRLIRKRLVGLASGFSYHFTNMNSSWYSFWFRPIPYFKRTSRHTSQAFKTFHKEESDQKDEKVRTEVGDVYQACLKKKNKKEDCRSLAKAYINLLFNDPFSNVIAARRSPDEEEFFRNIEEELHQGQSEEKMGDL